MLVVRLREQRGAAMRSLRLEPNEFGAKPLQEPGLGRRIRSIKRRGDAVAAG